MELIDRVIMAEVAIRRAQKAMTQLRPLLDGSALSNQTWYALGETITQLKHTAKLLSYDIEHIKGK